MKEIFTVATLSFFLLIGNPTLQKKKLPNGVIETAQKGDVALLEKYLREDSTLINATDSNGLTLLEYSTAWHNVAASRLLLSLGANPYAVNNEGTIFEGSGILSSAIEENDYEMLELFLDAGFKINYIDSIHSRCDPLLCMAAQHSTEDLVSLLLRRGANVHIKRFSDGNTPLHCCCEKTFGVKDRDIIATLLLNAGADVNAKNNAGQTPLFEICLGLGKESDTSLISFLVHHGANIDAIDSMKGTPLIYVIMDNKIDAVKALLANGADINLKGTGVTSLGMAVTFSHLDVVKFLLENHANVNAKGNEGNTVLYSALKKYYSTTIRIGKDDPILVQQLKEENKQKISLLLQYGADINAANNLGETPLTFAESQSDTEIVKLLKK